MNFDNLLINADKVDRVFATFKISMFVGVIVNIILIILLFKLTDIAINKLKKRFITNDNAAAIGHIFIILDRVIKSLIVFFIVASFLQSHGYSLTSLIAGFGITGLAVGFAAQQTIASMFGTLGILTDKVYKIGDYIRVNNFEGTVESISLRSTKIRSLDNFQVSIPNSVIASNIVENISRAHKRLIKVTFGVTYNTSDEKIQKAIDILKNISETRNDIYNDYRVNLDALDASSINIKLTAYAKTGSFNEYERIRGELLQQAIKEFRKENIEFAFPSTTVYIAKNEN